MKNLHVVWHERLVTKQDRNRLNKHRSGIVWFTGLPAAGKSTIAHHLEKELYNRGIRAYVLDGDNVRHGLCSNLGFTREDRKENLRRIAEMCNLFIDAGMVVLTAFVSPYKEDREYARSVIGNDVFLEVHVKCSVDVCEKRDLKDHYRKAKEGIIKNFTGVSDPYEEPENPDLVIDTEKMDVEGSVQCVLELLGREKFLLII